MALDALCVPSALYAGGAAGGALAMADLRPGTTRALLGVALAMLVAWLAYLVDRVKPLRRWMDPADAAACPRRDAWLRRHRPQALALTAGVGLLAVVAGWLLSPVLALLAPASAGASVAYGCRPSASRRPRPKDLLPLKNALTGLAYATLVGGVLLVLTPMHEPTGLPAVDGSAGGSAGGSIVVAIGVLALLVAADAMRCDLDDRPSDRAFGTRTVAVAAGPMSAIVLASLLDAAAVCLWLGAGAASPARAAFALGLPVTGPLLAHLPQVRTPIDLRGAALGTLALVLHLG